MRRLTAILVTLSYTITVASVQAETIDPSLAKGDTCGRYEIFHINGVDTDSEGAAANLDRLQAEFGNAHDGHLIFYGLLFNSTAGLGFDLLDAARQVIADFPGITLRDYFRWIRTQLFPDSDAAEKALDISARIAGRLGLTAPDAYNDADLASMVQTLRSTHQQDGRILLVPHSQGNLYANLVWERAVGSVPIPPTPSLPLPPDSISMVGVATPTHLRSGQHVTSRRDLVIRGVRLIAPASTPAANVSLFYSASDPLGHSFRDVYLTQNASKTNIVLHMRDALASLKSTVDIPRGTWMTYLTSATHYNCGPYPALLGPSVPGPWDCYVDSFTTPIWRVPVVEYYVPEIGGRQHRAGGISELESLASAHANGCVAPLVSLYLYVRNTGDRTWRAVGSCGGHPLPQPFSQADTAWAIYSADGPGELEFIYHATSQRFGLPYATTVTATLTPSCRR